MTSGAAGEGTPPVEAHRSPNSDAASLDVNPSATPRSPPPPAPAPAPAHAPSLLHETQRPESWETDDTDLKQQHDAQVIPGDEKGDDAQHDGPGGSTRFIKDPQGDLTHDETTVDVVTVPCPGADPLRSWNRDGLLGRYFGAPSMRDPEVDRAAAAGTASSSSWVRQGIRREADVARILLYEHPSVAEGMTLGNLADALLVELRAVRDDENGRSDGPARHRPLVFVGHSIGGLVVKMALAKASRDAIYEDILRDCYGVAFFGEFGNTDTDHEEELQV